MNDEELKRILNLIKDNKTIIMPNKKFFTKGTFNMLKAVFSGNVSDETVLTEEQKNLIIEAFIVGNQPFKKNTPNFILKTPECIKSAISKDINGVNFLTGFYLDKELEAFIIDEALRQGYILNPNSPSCLKSNFQVAKNSLRIKPSSADYIDWWNDGKRMTESEREMLVKELLATNYYLTESRHLYLANRNDVALHSLEKNKYSAIYISEKTQKTPEIFKYLMLHNCDVYKNVIREQKLSCFDDPEIVKIALEKLDIYTGNNQKYLDRLTEIYYTAIKQHPTIAEFNPIIKYLGNIVWDDLRDTNYDLYDNIFGKICSILRNANTFEEAISNSELFSEIKYFLQDKYSELYCAMQEYYNLFHSDIPDKVDRMESSKNIIANLSALYISKCKDECIKEVTLECYDNFYEYFGLKTDHPYVYKRLILSKKREYFRSLFIDDDPEINKFVTELINKYSVKDSKEFISNLISNFVVAYYNDFSKIINVPDFYEEYLRYQKANKLIYRLNRGYIKYDGPETLNYHDIISYDELNNKYIYTGRCFDEKRIEIYLEYERKKRLFENLKKDIILKVSSLECDLEIDYETLAGVARELPFTDEYYVYDDEPLESLTFRDLIYATKDSFIAFNPNSFISDTSYQYIYDLLITKRMLWFIIFVNGNSDYEKLGFSGAQISDIINNMESLVSLADNFNLNLYNLKDLFLGYQINKVSDESDIAILGKEIIEKLYKHTEYTNGNIGNIINIAKELICQMAKRDRSTVPYISGKYLNYYYSMYDSLDETFLISGINTDACFRINGNDNDFFHYCALDKNGFVIKITDEFGNFIARASGFRNGNCVFVNQLRTIYDQGGNTYLGECEEERKDIIKAFKKACQDIVNISQNNPNEKQKIDYVFVTKSYSFENYKSNISGDVLYEIGRAPMDTESQDWENFINMTDNLDEAPYQGWFSTDYENYPVICVASIKPPKSINSCDIKKGDVPAIYERNRNKVIVSTTFDPETCQRINKVAAMISYFNQTKFKLVEPTDNSVIITGDNWYIIYRRGKIINGCILNDLHAQREYNAIVAILQQINTNDTKQSLDDLAVELATQFQNKVKKRLKKNSYKTKF